MEIIEFKVHIIIKSLQYFTQMFLIDYNKTRNGHLCDKLYTAFSHWTSSEIRKLDFQLIGTSLHPYYILIILRKYKDPIGKLGSWMLFYGLRVTITLTIYHPDSLKVSLIMLFLNIVEYLITFLLLSTLILVLKR